MYTNTIPQFRLNLHQKKIESNFRTYACFQMERRDFSFWLGNKLPRDKLAGQSGDCAEAYFCTPHKQNRRLTPPGRKRTLSDGNYGMPSILWTWRLNLHRECERQYCIAALVFSFTLGPSTGCSQKYRKSSDSKSSGSAPA